MRTSFSGSRRTEIKVKYRQISRAAKGPANRMYSCIRSAFHSRTIRSDIRFVFVLRICRDVRVDNIKRCEGSPEGLSGLLDVSLGNTIRAVQTCINCTKRNVKFTKINYTF